MTLTKNLSFKVKTILGVAVIETFLLAIIYFTSINSLNETNENQIKLRATETSTLISHWVRNGLITYDVGNTENFINSLVESEGLVYIHVKNGEGKTFAFAGDPKFQNKNIEPDNTLKQANGDGVFDVAKPIKVDNFTVGHIEIGLSVEKLSEFIDDVANRIKLIAAIEVLLSALFSYALGWLLTRRLLRLQKVAIEVSETGLLQTTGDQSNDEIGTVSQAFDKMSSSLINSQIALKANAMKLEEIFKSTRDGMVVISTNGTILTANPAFFKLINCVKDFEGANFETFIQLLKTKIDSDDYESVKWLNATSQIYKVTHSDKLNTNIRFASPNKRLLNVSHKLIDDEETQIHSILFFMDLTKTEEVERLKSEFVAHAAHELRTPLTSVQGFSELLMSSDVSSDERIEFANIINSQSKRVVEMVSELLDIARIESEGVKLLDLQKVSLKPIVEKTIKEFSVPENRKPISVYYNENVKPVLIDVDRIYQVLLNIISNAYKYSSEGDSVSLYVDTFEYKEDVLYKEGVQIQVIDTGMGMSQEQLEHLFDRFWRGDTSGAIPGTGLGMSIVKEVLEIHSAKIEVSSELNSGTQVVIKFYR